MSVSVEVQGLREVQNNMERIVRDLHGPPMLQAFRDATLKVQRDARIATPVDTGRLRASITPEVRAEGQDVIGVVGSNVVYAPYVEMGTRPHWPPRNALEVWASRHGIDVFLVARAISIRGTPAHRMLQNSFEKNRDYVVKRVAQAVAQTIREAK